MAEFTGTDFLFKKKPSSRPAFRVTSDRWYSRIPPDPLEPPQPPAPPAPPAPPVPPTPPAPPVPPVPPFGADDDVQDAEDGWRTEGNAGADGGTEADTEAATEAGTAEDVFPEGAPGGDDDDGVEYWHKPNDHKRQAYTAAEKLKWVTQLDLAVSVRALARESGIDRKCLANWKRAADFLKEAHSARCRMHGCGRASWYRPMEIKVYERLLDWRRKGTAVSVGRLQEWSREDLQKLVCYADVVVSCHKNGWMDANGVIQWLEECVKPFLKPGFGRHARSSMVVLDSYRGHLTEAVKEKFRELNCVPAIISSGCTAEIQPLDVSINKSFKASVRQQYQKWFQEECQEQLTKAGNLNKPPPEVVMRWISRAWKAVPADLIKRAFLTCGISNALDGSEDGLAMAHRRSQLTAEVDVDDSIIADGFFGNNCQEPESDED
ncbi:unnamed protein product [Closterium sp. NIES-54]